MQSTGWCQPSRTTGGTRQVRGGPSGRTLHLFAHIWIVTDIVVCAHWTSAWRVWASGIATACNMRLAVCQEQACAVLHQLSRVASQGGGRHMRQAAADCGSAVLCTV
jgi:hypothetical protein